MFCQMTFAVVAAALVACSSHRSHADSALLWFADLWLILVYANRRWISGRQLLAEAVCTGLRRRHRSSRAMPASSSCLVAAIKIGARRGYGRDNFAASI